MILALPAQCVPHRRSQSRPRDFVAQLCRPKHCITSCSFVLAFVPYYDLGDLTRAENDTCFYSISALTSTPTVQYIPPWPLPDERHPTHSPLRWNRNHKHNTSRLQLALSPSFLFLFVAVDKTPMRASSLSQGRDATWKVRRSQLPNEEIFVDAQEKEDEGVFLEAIQMSEAG